MVSQPEFDSPDCREEEDLSQAPPGWEAIAEWTGGLAPESVEELASARELELVYPLLHSFVGRSPRDFIVRAAVLESLLADGRARFSSSDLAEVLYWLDAESRHAVLRALRHSGWLGFDPEQGTTVSDAGRWAHDVLSFLHKRVRESEILTTLAGIEYAMRIGLDPLRQLQSMRSRLIQLREEMEAARQSRSEVILRDAAKKVQTAWELSSQIRAVLSRIPVSNVESRRIAKDIHDLLSRLHGVMSDLEASISEIGRQYLRLTAGLSVEKIVRALMGKPVEELAQAMRGALLPVFVPPPLLTTEAVATAAEIQFLRERVEAEPVRWVEPPEPAGAKETIEVPAEVREFLSDLAGAANSDSPVPLSSFVPKTDAATSFLRASLLALAGEDRTGEGVAGQIGATQVSVETPHDAWPEDLPAGPIAKLTPGSLVPRKGARR